MKAAVFLIAIVACKSEPASKPAEPPKAEVNNVEPPKTAPAKSEPPKASEPPKPAGAPPVVELPAEYERRDEKSSFFISIRVPKSFKMLVSSYDDFINFEGPEYTFAVNAFVPEKSSQSMSESKDLVTSLNKDTFVKFTLEYDGDTTWRIDWDEKNGKSGTTMRIGLLDCGASGILPAQRDVVAAMCASIEKLK